MYADVAILRPQWEYVFEALARFARAYQLQFVLSVHTKKLATLLSIPTEVIPSPPPPFPPLLVSFPPENENAF